MGRKQPLLSICIPTYNRSEYLKEALLNIINDPYFNENVEIVISDNASTDNTEEIGLKYASKYNNVYYFRNKENIRDKNFILALKRSSGKYARLFNDTLRFKKGALQRMLDVIKGSSEDTPLFIYQNISFLNVECQKYVTNAEDFIANSSYWITWIANFGNWRSVIDAIPQPNEYASLLLAQVDWAFKIISHYKKCAIDFSDYFFSASLFKKGGYNFYNVFIVNYLKIVRLYVKRKYSVEVEKYRLFRYFILPWMLNLSQNKEKFYFDKEGALKITFKEYWYCAYFYVGFLWLKIFAKS